MSDSAHILSVLQEAVGLWYTVTGCPATSRGGITRDAYDLLKDAERTARLLELDPTGISAFMTLRSGFEQYLQDFKF